MIKTFYNIGNEEVWAMENEILEVMRSGFAQVVDAIGETSKRVDETNKRLDKLGTDMNERLDGVGSYLRSINGSVASHAERIYRLEKRVDKIEKKSGNS